VLLHSDEQIARTLQGIIKLFSNGLKSWFVGHIGSGVGRTILMEYPSFGLREALQTTALWESSRTDFFGPWL
jgi:hypothetical protein